MVAQSLLQTGVGAISRSVDPRVRTVLLMVTAAPDAATVHLARVVERALTRLLGPDHDVELALIDPTTAAVTIAVPGGHAGRAADPALAADLEAAVTDGLRDLGHADVAVAVVSEGAPLSATERADELWRTRLAALGGEARHRAEDSAFRCEIVQLLESGGLRTMFQAIVGAQDGHIVAYEALTRGPVGHRWERPDRLLAAAERAGLGSLLQWEMVRLARHNACSRLRFAEPLLFINAPDTKHWPEARADGSADAGVLWPWNRIIVEVSERSPMLSSAGVWEVRDRGRAMGIRFALDDVGAGYAGLASLALLAPEFVKVDMSIVRHCDRDPAKQAVISALVHYADRAGAQVIAEGVETAEELRVVRDLGAGLVQGFLLSTPSEHPLAHPAAALDATSTTTLTGYRSPE